MQSDAQPPQEHLPGMARLRHSSQQQSQRPAIDPAPSRWSYRFQRLMLTPLFRFALRVGLPMGAAFTAGMLYFADQDRRDGFRLWVADVKTSIKTRPEFMLQTMQIEGAGASVSQDIDEVIAVDFPVSSFDLDLDAMRQRLAELPAVKDVSLRVRDGGVLRVVITERVPQLLWRTRHGLALLDGHGNYVGQAEEGRTAYPALPLIVGEGADLAVPEALELISVLGPLAPRTLGVVRMGERRWDIVLDQDQRILLPEEGAVQALQRVIALNQVQDVMQRDLAQVDVRLGDRPTIRMNEAAVEQWWRSNKIGVED
jgi:cell division protein FtsQ